VTFECDLRLMGPYGTRKSVMHPNKPAVSFYAVRNAVGTRGQVPNYIIAPSGLTESSYCLEVRVRVTCTDASIREVSYADRAHLRHLGVLDVTADFLMTLGLLDASGSTPSLLARAQPCRSAKRPPLFTPLDECYAALGGAEAGGICNHVEVEPGEAGFGPRWKVTHLGRLRLLPGLREAALDRTTQNFRVLDVSRIAGALMHSTDAHKWAVNRFTAALHTSTTTATPNAPRPSLAEVRLSAETVTHVCNIQAQLPANAGNKSRKGKASQDEEAGFIEQLRYDSQVANLPARVVSLLALYPLSLVMRLDASQRAALMAVADACPLALASPHSVASMCRGHVYFRGHTLRQLAAVPVHRLTDSSSGLAMATFLQEVERAHSKGKPLVHSDQAGAVATTDALAIMGLVRSRVEGDWPYLQRRTWLAYMTPTWESVLAWPASMREGVLHSHAYDVDGGVSNMTEKAAAAACAGTLVITSRFNECRAVLAAIPDSEAHTPAVVLDYKSQTRVLGSIGYGERVAWGAHVLNQHGHHSPITEVMVIGADHLDSIAFVEVIGVVEVYVEASRSSMDKLTSVTFTVTSLDSDVAMADERGYPSPVVTHAIPRGPFPKIKRILPPAGLQVQGDFTPRSPWGTVPSADWIRFLKTRPMTGGVDTCPAMDSVCVASPTYLSPDCLPPDLVLYSGPSRDDRFAMDIAKRCECSTRGRSVVYVADTYELFAIAEREDAQRPACVSIQRGIYDGVYSTAHSQPRECCTPAGRAREAVPGANELLHLDNHDVRFGLVHAVREYRGPRVPHVVFLLMPGAAAEDLLAAAKSAQRLTVVAVLAHRDADVRLTEALHLVESMR